MYGPGAAFRKVIANFVRRNGGNVTLIFSLSLTVMFAGAGAAIDYLRLLQHKTSVSAAADAAVLAAISSAIEAEKAGASGIEDKAKQAALAAWSANLASAKIDMASAPEIIIAKIGTAWSAKVVFDENYPTTFMNIIGINSMKMAGTAEAGTTVEKTLSYWNIHVVVDDSSSMGIGATQADMDAMIANPKISCAFACHWDASNKNDSVKHAKTAGIKLRIDIVDEAVDAMVKDMKDASNAKNIQSALWGLNNSVDSLVPMTDKLNDVKNHKISLSLSSVSVGNTNYRAALDKLEIEVGKSGSGKSAVEPKKAVFIVTDGIHDSLLPESNTVKQLYDHAVGPIDPNFCSQMKADGVIVGVLYIDYIIPAGYGGYVTPYQADVLPNLKGCASDGLFFNATTPDGITSAMKEMLAAAFGFGSVRLTN